MTTSYMWERLQTAHRHLDTIEAKADLAQALAVHDLRWIINLIQSIEVDKMYKANMCSKEEAEQLKAKRK